MLDRKTGAGGTSSLYSYWVADIASSADYYPGGMMMPGRNTEATWSRMGYNGKPKDDEVYGKGNFQDYGFRMIDNRINRFISVDPLAKSYPWYTPYQFAGNSPVEAIDLDGLEEYHTRDGALLGKYGTSTEIRVVYDKYVSSAQEMLQIPGNSSDKSRMNNELYSAGSAGAFSGGDAAAADWAMRNNSRSILENSEYSSLLFRTKIDGKPYISYTQPLKGSEAKSQSAWGKSSVATLWGMIHSHGAYDKTYDNNNFSSFNDPDGTYGDIQVADKLQIPSYLSTPNGTLQKYTSGFGSKIISDKIPSDPSDPDRKNSIAPEGPTPASIKSPTE